MNSTIQKYLESQQLTVSANMLSTAYGTNQTSTTSKQISIHVDPVDNGFVVVGWKNGTFVRRVATSDTLMDEIQGVLATLKLEE